MQTIELYDARPRLAPRRPDADACSSRDALRLRVVSDLAGAPPPRGHTHPDVDVVVSAGDVTDSAVDTLRWLRGTFPASMPIVAVLGDREYRGADRGRTLADARRLARRLRIHLLEDHGCFVGGVRFVGATFWTDFRLHGDAAAARAAAGGTFADLDARNADGTPFDPLRSTGPHWLSRTWLGLTLIIPHDGPTVVVTHHAPTGEGHSMVPFVDPLAPTHASHCDDLVRTSGAALWIHGGPACDHVVGRTRVIACPTAGAAGWTTVRLTSSEAAAEPGLPRDTEVDVAVASGRQPDGNAATIPVPTSRGRLPKATGGRRVADIARPARSPPSGVGGMGRSRERSSISTLR